MSTPHFVSKLCVGEVCSICSTPASHKVGEEIASDDPNPMRHNLTAYICCTHFRIIMGGQAHCPITPRIITPDTSIIYKEFLTLLTQYFSLHPDKGRLANEWRCSYPTIELWSRGENLPHQELTKALIEDLNKKLGK